MYKATTPKHTFKLPINAVDCDKIEITYRQGNVKLIKLYENSTLPDGMTFNEKNVIIKMTQQETLKFNAKEDARVQVRVLVGDMVYASKKFIVQINGVLSEAIL